MATVNLATAANANLTSISAIRNSSETKFPYLIDATLDFAAAATAKGSGLATSDVIQVLTVPAKTVVLAAGIEYVTAVAGGVSALTISLGITGVLATTWLSAFDLFGATVGAYPVTNSAAYPMTIGVANDTIDVLLAGVTGTLATGVIRVWALVQDTQGVPNPGLALPGN